MRKGFTLIELLAVIVILAVIAVISIQIVVSVIEDSKLSAVENSVKFYIEEVEASFSEWVIEGLPPNISSDQNESGYIIFDVSDLDSILKLSKTKPVRGYVKINNDYTNNKRYYGYVVEAELEYDNGYTATYTYQNNEANVSTQKTK